MSCSNSSSVADVLNCSRDLIKDLGTHLCCSENLQWCQGQLFHSSGLTTNLLLNCLSECGVPLYVQFSHYFDEPSLSQKSLSQPERVGEYFTVGAVQHQQNAKCGNMNIADFVLCHALALACSVYAHPLSEHYLIHKRMNKCTRVMASLYLIVLALQHIVQVRSIFEICTCI